ERVKRGSVILQNFDSSLEDGKSFGVDAIIVCSRDNCRASRIDVLVDAFFGGVVSLEKSKMPVVSKLGQGWSLEQYGIYNGADVLRFYCLRGRRKLLQLVEPCIFLGAGVSV